MIIIVGVKCPLLWPWDPPIHYTSPSVSILPHLKPTFVSRQTRQPGLQNSKKRLSLRIRYTIHDFGRVTSEHFQDGMFVQILSLRPLEPLNQTFPTLFRCLLVVVGRRSKPLKPGNHPSSLDSCLYNPCTRSHHHVTVNSLSFDLDLFVIVHPRPTVQTRLE